MNAIPRVDIHEDPVTLKEGVTRTEAETDRDRRNWQKHPEAHTAVYRNHRTYLRQATNALARETSSSHTTRARSGFTTAC